MPCLRAHSRIEWFSPRLHRRALLAQHVTFHSPDDLVVAVAATGPARAAWEWVKWLPHVAHPRLSDCAGPCGW